MDGLLLCALVSLGYMAKHHGGSSQGIMYNEILLKRMLGNTETRGGVSVAG